jgi:hypothetical protein
MVKGYPIEQWHAAKVAVLELALTIANLSLHKENDKFLHGCRLWMDSVFYCLGDDCGLGDIDMDKAGNTSRVIGKMKHVAITMVVHFNPDPYIDIQYANGAREGTISFCSQTSLEAPLDAIRDMMFGTTTDLSMLAEYICPRKVT